MPVRQLARSLGCAAIAAAVVSCGGGGSDSGPSGTTGPTAPTVATVTVTPATNTLTIGSTAQLAAAATTSSGAAVGGLTATWSSSAQSVATVSGAGLVTAVAAGTSTITATMGGVSGTAALVVQAADFTPQGATTLSGSQAYQTVTIPAGVTVTAASNLDLTVAGAATIAGTLTGDCVRVRVIGRGSLTITGTLRNICATRVADPPEMKLVASTISVTNARLESAGALTVTNDSTITEASIGGSAGGALRSPAGTTANLTGLANQIVQSCRFEGTAVVAADGADGAAGVTVGGPGRNGASVTISCRGNLSISGSRITGGYGGVGGSATASGAAPVAVGGAGGTGGRVSVLATGGIDFGQSTALDAGSAGFGGEASAQATIPGGAAVATGGAGGIVSAQGFSPIVVKAGGAVSSSATVVFYLPYGGVGGRATATGRDGADASGGQPAQAGGAATATGGAGGSLSGAMVLTAGGGTSGLTYTFGQGRSRAGDGGAAFASSGRGGFGDESRPTGAMGGAASAIGGQGATSTITDWVGVSQADGGNGGAASISHGRGGFGFSDCAAGGAVRTGGGGGVGGAAAGRGGTGGSGVTAGTAGAITIHDFGVGGLGGNGVAPGAGGPAGADGTAGTRIEVGSPFRPGIDGSLCPVSRLTTTWTVPAGGDPNDHFLFVLFQGLATLNFNRTGSASLVAQVPGNRASVLGPTPITVTGASPWVTLTGTISPTGAVTATGTGTVAGYAGTQVRMSGTITDGAFTGTVVAGDQTPQTLPGGKITYSLTGPVRVP